MLATAAQLRDEQEIVERAVDEALERVGAGGSRRPSRRRGWPPSRPALRRLVLQRLAEQRRGRAAAAGTRPDARRSSGSRPRGGSGVVDLGGGVRAVAEYGVVRFPREPTTPRRRSRLRCRCPGRCRFGAWELECVPGRSRRRRASGSLDEPVLDADRLAPTLTVRAWRDGDRMRPLGLGGTKSLQDVFSDRKVPRSLRRSLPVVVSGDEIAWVAGVAVSEHFKQDERTAATMRLRARPCRSPTLKSDHLDCRHGNSRPHDPVGTVVVEADQLQRRVAELGAEISRDYEGRDLFMMGVLKGAVFFLADLMREVDVPCELDFMAVSSYGSLTDSSGVVRILKDLDSSIEGKDVLIVEDIVDSGLTLNYLLRNLRGPEPAVAGGVRAAGQAGPPEDRAADPVRGVRDTRTGSWSATGSTWTSGTEICPTWPRSTATRATAGCTPPEHASGRRSRGAAECPILT